MQSATKAQISNVTLTATADTAVNLTTEGSQDWSHWGINGFTQDHKAVNGTPVGAISDQTTLNSGGGGAYGDNRVAFSWSDGTPTATAVNTTSGIYNVSGSFEFTVPADTTTRIVKVYLGGVSVPSTQFTATLSTNTSGTPDYEDTTNNLGSGNTTFAPDSNHFYGVYSITYKGTAPGQTLLIHYGQTGGSGNITLQAATLFVAPTVVPAAPTNLTAIAGTNRVGLNWTAAATATSYNIKRGASATGTFTTIGTSTLTNFQDTTALNGTTYYYEVTAVNGIGEGPPSNVVSATPANGLDGTGVTGAYYNSPDVPNPKYLASQFIISQVDPTINFDVNGTRPAGVPHDNIGVIWTGAVKAPVNGAYVFTTASDDGIRLYIDGALVIDNFVYQGTTTRSTAPLTFTAGSYHTVRVTWFQGGGGGVAQLSWSYPGQSQQIVPTYALFPNASLFAPPAPLNLTGLPGAQSVTLTYGTPDNATSYNILRSLTAGGPYTTVKTGVIGGTYKDTGLTNGVTYYYVVQAVNAKGTSPNSNEIAVAPIAPVIGNGIGLAGTYYTGAALDFTIAEATTPILYDIVPTINFNAGNGGVAYNPTTFPDGVPKEQYTAVWTGQVLAPYTGAYQFQTITDDGSLLSLDTGSGYTVIVNNNAFQGPTTKTSASINLVANTRYNIKMEYAQGGGGETAQLLYNPLGSGFVIIPQTQLFPNFTAAPAAPTNLTAVGGSSLVNLGWTSSQGAITYNVLRGTKAGGPYTTIKTGVSATGYTDTTVINGTTYYYVVVAVNNIGTSSPSNEASATPALPALKLRYTFENGPSGTDPDPITDVTLSGNDGSLFGGDTGFITDAAQGVYAGLSVDATHYAALPAALDLGNQFTFFTYVKLSPLSGGNIQPIFGTSRSGGQSSGFTLYVNDFDNLSHAIVVETNTGPNAGNIQTKTRTLPGVFQFDGQYHAVAAVVNRTAGVVNVYYDGALVLADGVIDTHWSTQTGDNRLGQFANADIVSTNAQFDDVRLYGGLLNAADIAGLSGSKVTGNIALEGVADLSALNINAPLGVFDIQLRAHNSLVPIFENKNVTLITTAGSANGKYTLTNITPGTYDVWIKGNKNLAVLVPNVVVSGVTTTVPDCPDVLLNGGDVDNDNTVGPTDFATFVTAYNTDASVIGGGYDPTADFNFDGIVDPTDFGIFVGDYNTVGAP